WHPERMDLPDTLAAAAKQHGVRFVLSTDSHQPGNLPFMKYAVYLARRAGLEAADILNTRPLAEFRKGLKRAGEGGRGRERSSPVLYHPLPPVPAARPARNSCGDGA